MQNQSYTQSRKVESNLLPSAGEESMGLISKTISPSPPPLSIMKVTVLKQSTYLKMTLDGVLTTSTFLGVQAQVTMSGSCDGGDGAQPGLCAC